MKVMHFNSQAERLKFLKGEFEEIKPVKSGPKKAKKTAKGKKDEVQAE